jgi:hypothetical protein
MREMANSVLVMDVTLDWTATRLVAPGNLSNSQCSKAKTPPTVCGEAFAQLLCAIRMIKSHGDGELPANA